MKNHLLSFTVLSILLFGWSTNSFSQPGTFSLLSPGNGACANATPLFDWQNAANAVKYKLWVDFGSGLQLFKDNIAVSQYQVLGSEALPQGFCTWHVYGFSSSGDSTRSTETWTVNIDSTRPSAFDLVSPTDTQWTNNLRPTFSWTSSGDLGCAGLAKYQLWIDGTPLYDISPDSGSFTITFDLSNGDHSWFVKAIDGVGNARNSTGIWTVRVDNIPPGNINHAAFLNGTDAYVQVNHSPSLDLNHFTVEAWINFFTSTTYNHVIVNTGSWTLQTVGYSTSKQILFTIQQAGIPGPTNVASTSYVAPNTWYHVAAVYDGTTMKIYLNGNLDVSHNLTFSNPIITSSNDLYIGSTRGAGLFGGYIDEVRVWSYDRSDAQVFDNVNRTIEKYEPGLASCWRLNEPSGSIAHDISSNTNDGSLHGGVTFVLSPLTGKDLGPLCDLKLPGFNQFLQTTTPIFSWGESPDTGVGFQKYQLWIDKMLYVDALTDSTTTIPSALTYGKHSFHISGFDLLGNSQNSVERVFYVDNVRPNPFSLTAPLDSQILSLPTPNFKWQATSDSTGGSGLSKYQLWIDGSVNVDSIPVSTDSTAPNSALNEGSHTWFVKAYDKVGNFRTSRQTRTVFVDFNPPISFDLISPINNDTARVRRPTFTWRASKDTGSGLLKYELRISGQSTIVVYPPDTSKQITFDLPDGSYTWYVQAFDRGLATRNSNQTNTVIVKALVPPDPPQLTYPSNNANLGDDLTPDLAWNTVANANYFHAQLASDSLFNNVVAENDQIMTLNWTPTLSLYGKYYWRVKTHSTNGTWGNWSEKRFFTISLGIPILASPTNGASNQPTTLTLNWNHSTSPSTFHLQVATDSNFVNKIVNDSTLADTLRQVGPLSGHTLYCWRVRAKNSAGQSDFSMRWRFTTLNNPPTVVRLLAPTNNDTIKLKSPALPIIFSWRKSIDIDIGDSLLYSLVIKGNVLDTTISRVKDTTVTLNIMPRLQVASTYKWSVNVSDGFASIASVDTFIFRTSNSITGINRWTDEIPSSYLLEQNYPNPFNPSTQISFDVPVSTHVVLKVYSLFGQEVTTLIDGNIPPGRHHVTWNAAGISSGIYFIRMQASSFSETKKLLLLR